MRISEVPNYTVDEFLAAERISNLVLSSSSVGTFSCERKWFLKYLAKVPMPEVNTSIVGNIVHEVLERFYRMDRSDMRTKANLNTFCAQAVREYSDDAEHSDGTADSLKKAVVALAGRLFDIEKPNEVNVKNLELELSGDFGGIHITGMIDRVSVINQELSVDDYKTGSYKIQYVSQTMKQIAVYAALMDRNGMGFPKKGNILYLGGKRPKKYDFEITPKLIKETMNSFKVVADRIQIIGSHEENYFPNVTEACVNCPYSSDVLCPSGAAKRTASLLARV